MWASEVCATFFQSCGGSPPTTINVSVTLDSLRVCVAPLSPFSLAACHNAASAAPNATLSPPPTSAARSYIMTNTASTTMLAAADIASGKMIWTQNIWSGTEVVAPNALAMNGDSSALFVNTSAPTGAVFVKPVDGTTIAPAGLNITSCSFFVGKYAACETATGALAVLDTSVMPPAVAWEELALPVLIIPDQGSAGLLVAQLLFSSPTTYVGYDLTTGEGLWTLEVPGLFPTLSYNGAGALWATSTGYNGLLQYSLNVYAHTFSVPVNSSTPTPHLASNVSFPSPTFDANAQAVLTAGGSVAAVSSFNGTFTNLFFISADANGQLTASQPSASWPADTDINVVPGPADGQVIIGTMLNGLPSIVVYA